MEREAPAWAAVRFSHLDLSIAWMVCGEASTNGRGAISRVAASYGVSPSVVQKAVDRVEAAMGGRPLFLVDERRSGRLTDEGRRFVERADVLLEAWASALSVKP